MESVTPGAVAPVAGTDFAHLLANWAAGLDYEALPGDARDAAGRNLLDTLACAVAGSSADGVAELVDLVCGWGGAPQASLLTFGRKLPAHHAAWVNGMMAHARDYDDTHDEAVLHAGVSVVPAALAAAELKGGVAGTDLVAGVAAGLETVCRLGVATRIGIIESGYMYTSLFGYFGAAVAAARVLGLDAAQALNAIGIAYSQAAGNHQVTRDAALTKRMQPGFAAKAGLVSAQLAQRGIRGAQNSFEGVDGLFPVYLRNRYDAARLSDGLGTRYEFTRLGYKPYPCCRFSHTAIDAALKLRADHGLAAARIRRIEAGVNRQAHEAVCMPAEMRRGPKTVVQAQFSLPYAVAAALTDGRVGLGHFTAEGVSRADIGGLAALVHCRVDPQIEQGWSRSISPAVLHVELEDGTRLEQRIDVPTGSVARPMARADMLGKLRDCMGFAQGELPPGAPERLMTLISGIATLDDAKALADILNPEEPPQGTGL